MGELEVLSDNDLLVKDREGFGEHNERYFYNVIGNGGLGLYFKVWN